MNREKILKDLAKNLKVDIGQKFRTLTKPFENVFSFVLEYIQR